MFRRAAVIASLASLVLACTTSDDGVPVDSRLDTFARDYCQLTSEVCCPTIGRTNSLDGCQRFVIGVGERPSTYYNESAATRCLDGLRAARNAPSFCIDFGGGDTPAACNEVFPFSSRGSKLTGAACQHDSECAAYPEGEAVCSQGICQLQIHAKEGEACVGDRVHVRFGFAAILSAAATDVVDPICWESEGLYCSGTTKTCVKQLPAGGACTSNAATAELSACVTTARCESDVCVDGVNPARISGLCIN